MTRIERFADLAARVLDRPARLGLVRLVAVDGPTGAGKTSFAGHLAHAFTAPGNRAGPAVAPAPGTRVEVVHIDDLLDGWQDQLSYWSRLVAGVLDPLRSGRPGRYRRYDWVAGRFAEEHEVPVPDVLILDGGATARAAARPALTLSVFVTAPADLRLARVVARDGAAVAGPLRGWMAVEDEHFAADGTAARADLLVDGAPRVGHDPGNEYVRLSRPGGNHG